MSLFRSLLFVPGNHARRIEKAFTLPADAVILDLEDACPLAEKVATRPVVVAALQRPSVRSVMCGSTHSPPISATVICALW